MVEHYVISTIDDDERYLTHDDYFEQLFNLCIIFTFQVLIAPPLYRHRPSWYQSGLTQIAARFSSAFSTNVPPNLQLLPSFISQDLMPDGVFLTPVSGLHYVLHVFDQADVLLNLSQASGEAQFLHVREGVRSTDDRVSYLEQRHVHLLGRMNHKVAVDAEFDDWVTNKSEEDWLVIQRLKRLPTMGGQEWQQAARKQVTDLIKTVLQANRARFDFEVLLVVNPIRHITTGATVYNVQMDSVQSARRIRDLFSGFFRGKRPVSAPHGVKEISLRNKVTLATKVRISILHQLGSIFTSSNNGSTYNVRGFEPRPKLVTSPARNSGSYPRTYNFIQAVTSLRADFSDEHLVRIYQVIGNQFPGELKALFIVLNDDDRDRCLALVKADRERRGGGGRDGGGSRGASVNFAPIQSTSGSSRGSAGGRDTRSTSGQVHGSGGGMEVESTFLASLKSPPPPPPSGESPSDGRRRPRSRSPSPRVDSERCSKSPAPDELKKKTVTRKSRSRSRSHSRSHSRSRSPHGGLKRCHLSSDRDEQKKPTKKKQKRSRRRSSSLGSPSLIY